jgi:uncharacterized protein YbjT (DUF2867 family)
MIGVDTVISAVQGFEGPGGVSPQTVDRDGNSHLIQAARAAGVGHFILVSILSAAPDSPMELFRMKYLAEQELLASGLTWTIIRPTAYMETWSHMLGDPLLKTGKTRVFGRGTNPINFVSAGDVARFIDLAVVDGSLRGTAIDVGGPENLTMRQFVQIFQEAKNVTGSVSSVPLPMMRVLAVVLRPFKPSFARVVKAGVVMDTRDLSYDATDRVRRYPSIPCTSLADVLSHQEVAPIAAVS